MTTPARTVVDLAARTSDPELERLVAEMHALRLPGANRLEATAAALGGHRGAARVRRLLAAERGPAFTRSEAERRFLALIRAAQLPEPLANRPLHGHEVDFLWPDARLVVEIDGFAFHSGRGRFERDRARDAVLMAAGFAVMRVTWRQLIDQPEAVVARVAQALATRS